MSLMLFLFLTALASVFLGRLVAETPGERRWFPFLGFLWWAVVSFLCFGVSFLLHAEGWFTR